MGLAASIKKAFLNQWNLLVLAGASAFAVLTGRPDIALPLVVAGELGYLTLLGTHPKFQKYLDAREAKARRTGESPGTEQALARILRELPKPLLGRFESLRQQCQELRQIARSLSESSEADALPLDSFQVSGLDRLLWIYLRLLFTHFTLARFLEKTQQADIEKNIERLKGRIAKLGTTEAGTQQDRVRKTLEDNLETSRLRLDNLRKAIDNHELVKLEIDRLENKIRSLSELAVNRREPGDLSHQVDHVAEGMLQTEHTINELQFATGLQTLDDETPELLAREVVRTEK